MTDGKTFFLSAVIVISTFISTGSFARPRENFVDCNANQIENTNAVWDYIRDNIPILRNDYEWNGRLPRDRERVNRRMRREINDTTVVCDRTEEFRCRSGTGRTPGGVFTSRIHICFDKIDQESTYSGGTRQGFCRLAGVIAHEYGHSIGMQRRPGHDSGDLDEVRMFGRFVRDMCVQDALERDLTPFEARAASPPSPTNGIILFPKSDPPEEPGEAGRGRHFPPGSSSTDLRQIGRNNSTTSIQVLSGTWEVCNERNYRGWCLELNGAQSVTKRQLQNFGMNNQISSIRSINLPRTTGITLYRERGRTGPSAHFDASTRDLSQWNINNKARSLHVIAGNWRVCKNKDFENCARVRDSVLDLREMGFNRNISSLELDEGDDIHD